VGRRRRLAAVGRAPATLGLLLTIAIIGGELERFVPLVELYREAWQAAGHDARPTVAINTHTFVGASSEDADERFAPGYLGVMNRIGRERGWGPSGMAQFQALRSPRGALAAGSSEEVAEKILYGHELFGHQRYLGHMSLGSVAHADVLRSMERFGTDVAPVVRAEVARREAPAAMTHR